MSESEKDFDRLREEVNSIIDDFHRDLEKKFSEEKAGGRGVKEGEANSKITKLEEYVKYNIETLKEGLESNKKIITSRLESMKVPTNSSDLR